MRFNNLLEDILGKRSNISILRLFASENAEMTGRQIAGLTGLAHRTCLMSLEGLVKQSIISVRSVGSANLYKLKSENFLMEQGVLPLFKLEKGLLISMVAPLLDIIDKEAGHYVHSVALFGKITKAAEEPNGDVDICIILREHDYKTSLSTILEPVREHILRAFGNKLSLHMLTVEELKERLRRDDQIIQEVLESEYVWGEKISRLLT